MTWMLPLARPTPSRSSHSVFPSAGRASRTVAFSPSPQAREAFLWAVFDYGLNQRPPDFSEEPDADLLRLAWNHVERWLVGGWTLSQKRSAAGSAGGAPKGNQNARKHPPTVEEE